MLKLPHPAHLKYSRRWRSCIRSWHHDLVTYRM